MTGKSLLRAERALPLLPLLPLLLLMLALALSLRGGQALPLPEFDSPAPAETVLTGLLAETLDAPAEGAPGAALSAAHRAGALLDWYAGADAATARREAAAYARTLSPEQVDQLAPLLDDTYRMAVRLAAGEELGLVRGSGRTLWQPEDAETLFRALYRGVGLLPPPELAE